jgi:murein DD-endopeptidase MepM/ murein hydrolase activator NlpD
MDCIKWFTSLGWKVTSPFGRRIHPIDKVEKMHTGIDFGGFPIGEPVKTPTGGIVTHAKSYSGWGNLVRVEDPRGYGHLFAHLDKLAVKAGKTVKRGDIIGTNGKTGKVTGPHVHYQINLPDGGVSSGKYWGDPAKYIYWEDLDMPKTYRVVAGDTLYKIAKRFNVTVQELREWNGRTPEEDKSLQIGTLLYVENPKKTADQNLGERLQKLDERLQKLDERLQKLEDILSNVKNIL